MTDFMTPTDEEIASAFGVDNVDEITDEMLDDVETPDTLDTVDVSDYSTPAGAAKATATAVRALAESLGHDPELEVTCRKEDDAWVVYYEAGPSNWAYNLTGGQGFYGGSDPQVDGLIDADGFDVECKYSFALSFYGR